MPNCQCGCGEYTGSSFVRGHQFLHRTALLSLVTLTDTDDYNAGAIDAYDELRERGWLVSQGYGSYGTGRNVPASARVGNRSTRRSTQRNRSNIFGGHYVPDNAIVGATTGATFYRANTASARLSQRQLHSVGDAQNTRPTRVNRLQVECPCTDCGADAFDHCEMESVGYLCRTCYAARVAPTFGVEIELSSPSDRYRVADVLNTAFRANADSIVQTMTCEAQSYNHASNNRGKWKVVTDASISGCELVSPILRGDIGFKALKVVCDALDAMGARTDSACGLHVHHGADNMTVDQIISVAELYTNAQPLINSVLPTHRTRYNTFCKQYYAETLREYAAGARQYGQSYFGTIDRYYTVNLSAIARHGTLEFRQHNGTITYQAIANWVRFGQRVIATVLSGFTVDYSTLETFLRSLDCEERTVAYYLTRAERTARNNRRVL